MHGQKTWIEISKSALEHNFQALRALVAPTEVAVVLKANAYGHGLVEVGQVCAAAGAKWMAVDWTDEALALRRTGIAARILVMGYTPPERMVELVAADVSFVVYTRKALEAAEVAGTAVGKKAKIHLKLETGLHRQGIEEEDLEAFIAWIDRCTAVEVEGVSTHFANIEDTDDAEYATKQREVFLRGYNVLRRKFGEGLIGHTACSAAAVLFPDTRFSLVREGIMLYGIWSAERTRLAASRNGISLSLQPVMTWKTVVAQAKSVRKGDPISYGLTETMAQDGKIAVLPIGYADGYDRVGLSGKGFVLVRGRRCKILGRVCMNMCMVDVTTVDGVEEGDEVVLLGKQGMEEVTAEELAEWCSTIAYEVLARINPLITRKITQ